MSLYNTTGILSQCVPYGFQKNHQILCQPDDVIQTNTQNYTIRKNTDFEEILLHPEAVRQEGLVPLLNSAPENVREQLAVLVQKNSAQSVWMAESTHLVSEYNGEFYSGTASEAGILCGSFYDDFVYENYTALPDSPSLQAVRTEYADLLSGFDARTASPAETFLRLELLRNRVCDTVSYTLAPGKTPADTDHTAWFLLENKKGYCEHYATAGTVLARMAGIPARYCEGYMIDCSQSGTLTLSQDKNGDTAWTSDILDSNAHAWTEIYISGLGWIPFEFTFSYFTSHISPEITYVPETEHSETVPPVTVPVPEVSEPEHETETSVPELSAPAGIPANILVIISILTISALLCLTALILRIVRLAVLRKRQARLAQDDRKKASFCAYQYLTELLRECGVHTKGKIIGDLVEESETLCSQYMDSVYSLSSAVQIGAKLRYSPHPVTNSELHYLTRTANALAEGMYQQAGIFRKFYLKWLRHYL